MLSTRQVSSQVVRVWCGAAALMRGYRIPREGLTRALQRTSGEQVHVLMRRCWRSLAASEARKTW